MGRLLKLLMTVSLLTISCGHQQHGAKIANIQEALSSEALLTASTVASPPTTLPRVSRSHVRSVITTPKPKATYASAMPDDFWWRLSHSCECSGGNGCANSGGWFQFKGGTVRAVGYFPGATYDQQLGMAKWWLIQIKGLGWTTSGWPVCWRRSL